MLKIWQRVKDFFALLGVLFSVVGAAWAIIRARNLRSDTGRNSSVGGYLDEAISGNSKAQDINDQARSLNSEAQEVTATIERDNISSSEHIDRAGKFNEEARSIIDGIKSRGTKKTD